MVFEEDIEIAVEHAISILGPQGRMIPASKSAIHNAYLVTKSHGEIWYGDLEMGGEMMLKIAALSEKLGENAQIIVSFNRFPFNK